MADARDWSVTPGSNTDLFPEGMSPAAVNDGMRTVQAELAQIIKDEGGSLTTAGTATAYTLALSTGPAALSDGLYFSATAHATNTGAATLAVTGASAFTAKKIRTFTSGAEADLPIGAMIANGHYLFQYDSAADSGSGAFILLNPDSNGTVLIRSQSFSASSAVTFTTGITSDYRAVVAVGSGILASTTATNIVLQVSANSGGLWLQGTTGQYIQHWRQAQAATFANSYNAATTGILCLGNMGASEAGAFEATLYNPSSVSLRHQIRAHALTGIDASGNLLAYDVTGQSIQAAGGAINGIRFLPSVGTISGTISLFGIR